MSINQDCNLCEGKETITSPIDSTKVFECPNCATDKFWEIFYSHRDPYMEKITSAEQQEYDKMAQDYWINHDNNNRF